MSIYRNGVRLSLSETTGDYAQLDNLPSINGTQLIGDINLSSTSIETVSALPTSGISQGKLYKYGNTLNWWSGTEWKQLGSSSVTLTDVAKAMYPVGAIYFSVSSTNPSTLFGGTWAMMSDNFLLATGTYDAGEIGGETTAQVTIAGTNSGMALTMNPITLASNTMPSHTHTSSGYTGSVTMTTAMTFTGNSVQSSSSKAGVSLSESPHNHSITFYASNKSGTATLTCLSYSENKGSYTSTTSGSKIGLSVSDSGHTHYVTTKGSLSKGDYTFTGSAATSSGTGGDTSKATVAFTPSVKSYTQPIFTGEDQTVNILPPYLPVYMWQRIS